MDFPEIKILFQISPLTFAFASQRYKIQHSIPVRNTKQVTDFFIRRFPSATAVPDMYPTCSEIVLLGSKQDIGRGNCPIFNPEFPTIQF